MRLCVKDQRQVVGVLEASAADEGRPSERRPWGCLPGINTAPRSRRVNP